MHRYACLFFNREQRSGAVYAIGDIFDNDEGDEFFYGFVGRVVVEEKSVLKIYSINTSYRYKPSNRFKRISF